MANKKLHEMQPGTRADGRDALDRLDKKHGDDRSHAAKSTLDKLDKKHGKVEGDLDEAPIRIDPRDAYGAGHKSLDPAEYPPEQRDAAVASQRQNAATYTRMMRRDRDAQKPNGPIGTDAGSYAHIAHAAGAPATGQRNFQKAQQVNRLATNPAVTNPNPYGKKVDEVDEVEEGLEETQMKIDHDQLDMAVAELGSVMFRMQRAGLSETQTRRVVSRLLELDELPVSCDEIMWNHAEPDGDESPDSVKGEELKSGKSEPAAKSEKNPWDHAEPDGDESPKAVREGDGDGDEDDEKAPDTVRDSGEDAPATVRDPETKHEGWDKFMDQILISEGRKEIKTVTSDSPGMLHAKRYGEKAHNRIVWKK